MPSTSLADHGIDTLVAIGGEDTLGVATSLHEHGVHVVGVPTFGFDTALNIGTTGTRELALTVREPPFSGQVRQLISPPHAR